MENEEFEWDDAKASSNAGKHGVDFWTAIKVFGDPLALDDFVGVEGGEERFQWIGRVGGALILVVYTPRGERRRIISARQTTRREDDRYYRENAQD